MIADAERVAAAMVGSGAHFRAWSDALFMAPPLFARRACATGCGEYLDYAEWHWRITVAKLHDPEERLYYRDARAKELGERNGARVFSVRKRMGVRQPSPAARRHAAAAEPSRAALVRTAFSREGATDRSTARARRCGGRACWTRSSTPSPRPAAALYFFTVWPPTSARAGWMTDALAQGCLHLDRACPMCGFGREIAERLARGPQSAAVRT